MLRGLFSNYGLDEIMTTHKDALVEERAYKAQEKCDLIQHINLIRRMVGTYASDPEINGETRETLNELARDIDALKEAEKDD